MRWRHCHWLNILPRTVVSIVNQSNRHKCDDRSFFCRHICWKSIASATYLAILNKCKYLPEIWKIQFIQSGPFIACIVHNHKFNQKFSRIHISHEFCDNQNRCFRLKYIKFTFPFVVIPCLGPANNNGRLY